MISSIEILKDLSILIILAIPPWIIFLKYLKKKPNKFILFLLFILYMLATLFAQNLPPFILVIYMLIREGKIRKNEKLLKPLGNKKFEIILYSLAFKFFITIVTGIFAILLMKFGLTPKAQEVTNLFLDSSWFKIILLSIMTVIFAPIVEEFVFRHIFYNGFRRRTNDLLAAVFSSALFMILHYNLLSSLATFVLGLFNCRIYDKYGYRAAVLNHFIFNLISVMILIALKATNIQM